MPIQNLQWLKRKHDHLVQRRDKAMELVAYYNPREAVPNCG